MAQCRLAECYQNGVGVEKDTKEAVRWYESSAAQGNAMAQFMMALHGTADANEVVLWCRLAAEQGLAKAQFHLGVHFDQDAFVKDAKAAGWYHLEGNATAPHNLGVYVKDAGVEKDAKEAARWYGLAAQQEHAWAQFRLGVCFYRGEGVSLDVSRLIMATLVLKRGWVCW